MRSKHVPILLLLIGIIAVISLYNDLKTKTCNTVFSTKEVHGKLSKNHTWKYDLSNSYSTVPTGVDKSSIENIWKYDILKNYPENLDFLIKYRPETCRKITSYAGEIRDGLSIKICSRYLEFKKNIETIAFVDHTLNGKPHGFGIYYGSDGKIKVISTYSHGNKNGIYMQFDFNKPNYIHIFHNNESVAYINFLFPGILPFMEENEQIKLTQTTYKNGQKCIDTIEEKGIKYWIFYNVNGAIVLKWPKDNDFCKAQFYFYNKQEKIAFEFNYDDFLKFYNNKLEEPMFEFI